MSLERKIGLIAGSGSLPYEVINGAREQGYSIFIVAFHGVTKVSDFDADGASFKFGEIGKIFKTLKKQNCSHVVFAGSIARPDFANIKPDFRGIALLPKIVKAAAKGDDALLKLLVSTFEKEGFDIVSPQDLCRSCVISEGVLGNVKPSEIYTADIKKAYEIAGIIGSHDIGQGAIVAGGLVLAVEAQEGTDEMLMRVADMSTNIRGNNERKLGVLVKRLKPGQEERVDLPTIGLETVELAHKAGLAGIVVQADKAFVMNSEAVQSLANKYELFILGYKGE